MTAKLSVLVVKVTALRGNIGGISQELVAYNALPDTCKCKPFPLLLFIYLRVHRYHHIQLIKKKRLKIFLFRKTVFIVTVCSSLPKLPVRVLTLHTLILCCIQL